MDKIKFINSLIKTYEHSVQKIEERKQKCGILDDDKGFKDAIENLQDYKDILNTYKEIKADLEAWEVVKKYLILDKEFHQIDLHLHHNTKDKEDYLKLKKTLEVK